MTTRSGSNRLAQKSLLGVAALLLTAAMCTPTHALKISDTFTLDETTRIAGTGISGINTELGAAAWLADSSIKFGADGTATRVGSAGNNVAVFPFVPNPLDTTVTLTARVRPGDTGNDSPNFLGVGFTDNLDKQPFWSDGGAEIWMYLSERGGYEVFIQGTKHALRSSTAANSAPGFIPDDFNTLELRLDRATNKLTALINGTAVVNNFPLYAWGDYTPNIGGAGAFMFANQSTIDQITAISTGAPVPGDTNHDSKVDFADYLILESSYGSAPTSPDADADFDNNNVVEFADYLVLEANYGVDQSVPEPMTLTLLGLGGLALLRRRA